MKINYILSDTTKGATSLALKNVIEKAEADVFGDYVVIVPETKSIIIEKELLALSKHHAFTNIFVYSFVRLISRLGFVDSNKIVTKQTCVMLLRKIIFDHISELKCYQKTAKTVSFAEKVYDTIQQFKSSNVTVSDLKSSLLGCSKSLKNKLEDLVLLYELYEERLSTGLFDDCDKLNLIAKFAKDNQFIKNAQVFVVGFDNVTFEMVSVLKELAKAAKEITFSCVYFNDKRADSYIQNNELFKKFKLVGDELKYPYQPTFTATLKQGDFRHIQHGLFVGEKLSQPAKNLEVFEAKNRRWELDFVANKILAEVKDGKRFKDIGVYVCSLADNVELIKKCFDSYQIPYFINEDHDISNHALIKFVKSCFEIYLSHLAEEKVLRFLSGAFVKNKSTAEFENYAKEVGLNYNSFLAKIDEEYVKDEAKIKRLNAVILPFHDFYAQFSSKIDTAKTVSDYLNILSFVFEYFDVRNKLENIAEFQRQNGDVVGAEISLAIFEKCEEFIKSFDNFMGATQIIASEFLQVFLSGFVSIKLNLSPVSIDSVIVQENTDGFFNIKTMFVVGSEENKFPAKIQDSGIILDGELEETKALISKAVEPSVKDINERELFRAYEAFLEPTEKLFVSYVAANKPARMVLRLFALFGEEIKTKTYKKIPFASKKGAEMRFARHINEFLNSEINLTDLNSEYSILKDSLSSNFKFHLENNLVLGEKNFVLESASQLYFPKGTTSISQLEKYFTCPYMFFATYGLRLKENKVAKLSHLDIGSIVHRIAELFVQEISTFDGLDDAAFKAGVDKICQGVFAEYNVNKNRNKAILNFIESESQRLCAHLYFEQQNSSFKSVKNEYEFAGENAVKLQAENGRVVLIEGKIDRIDQWGDYVRIIDYKTGDIKNDLSSIYYGKKIQLVSYLSAVTGFSGKKVAGIFYFPIHSDFVKNDKKIKNIYKLQGFLINDADVLKHMDNTVSFEKPESDLIQFKIKTSKENVNTNTFEISKGQSKVYFDNDEFERMKTYNTKLCEGAVSEILSGYVEPSPMTMGDADSKVCRFCEFAGFCGLEKARFKDGRNCHGKVSIDSFVENNEGDSDGK